MIEAGHDAGPFGSEELVGAFLIQLVEVVIQLRRTGAIADIDGGAIASSCVRMLALSESDIGTARADAGALLGACCPTAHASGSR